MKATRQQEPVIFKGTKGQVKLRGDFRNDTIWATQAEIVELYGVDQSVVSRHITSLKMVKLILKAICKNVYCPVR